MSVSSKILITKPTNLTTKLLIFFKRKSFYMLYFFDKLYAILIHPKILERE